MLPPDLADVAAGQEPRAPGRRSVKRIVCRDGRPSHGEPSLWMVKPVPKDKDPSGIEVPQWDVIRGTVRGVSGLQNGLRPGSTVSVMYETRHQFREDLNELERLTFGGVDLVVGQLDRALASVSTTTSSSPSWSSPPRTGSTGATSKSTRAWSCCSLANRRSLVTCGLSRRCCT